MTLDEKYFEELSQQVHNDTYCAEPEDRLVILKALRKVYEDTKKACAETKAENPCSDHLSNMNFDLWQLGHDAHAAACSK